MLPRSKCIMVLLAAWLAVAPTGRLPTSHAEGAAGTSYPATSTPDPLAAEPWPSQSADGRMFNPPELETPTEAFPSLTDAGASRLLAWDELSTDGLGSWRKVGWLGLTFWDSGVELGLNGSSGSSDSLSIRTGGYIKRQSRFSKLDLTAYYNSTSNSGATTQSNAQFDVRDDWLLDEGSPWMLFSAGTLFYDEFQAFDVQINGNVGIGYRVVDAPSVTLVARCGAGASREFGGPERHWVPESLFGFQYDRRYAKTQKLYGRLDYYPGWEAAGTEYRMVAEVGSEIELAQPSNVSLKIAASDRFDSTPNGAEPHLVNYSVLLLLKL